MGLIVYGRDEESGWVCSITLTPGAGGGSGEQGPPGPQGEAGPQGPKGDKGDVGNTGAQGNQGQQGLQGEQGLPGEAGVDGDAGPQGDPGSQGQAGSQGLTGPEGPAGDAGSAGSSGADGEQGIQGPEGPQGPSGDAPFSLLANGATNMGFDVNGSVKVTPTASATYTTAVPAAGKRCTILILTSGTTSRTITFGSGFKPVGTLATGTTSGRVFTINFISDGTNLYEAGRTAAMAA